MERKIFSFIFWTTSVFLAVIMIVAISLLSWVKSTGASASAAGQWNFNETSGTVASDSSGNGLNGNLMNGPGWASGGETNGALSFDGVNDYAYVNLPASSFTSSVSFSVWIKTSSAGSILGFTDNIPRGGAHDKELFIDSGGYLNFRLYPQGTARSNIAVNDGNWHHIAALYNLNQSIQIYIDGSLQGSMSAQGQSASYGGYFTIGIQSQQDAGYFNGIIDEVKIFNYALSASEISSFYSATGDSGGGTVTPQGGGASAGTPDLDVTYIERTPRYERYNVQYSAAGPTGIANAGKKEPAAGDAVTFIAHVKNKGDGNSGDFFYVWKINGIQVYSGSAPSLAAGGEQTISYPWQWLAGQNNFVEFIVDPNNLISERYEQNNALKDNINAYYLRIQVEQEVYNNFNSLLNIKGTKSFEDWIQAHFAEINRMLERQGGGTNARVRIDEIAVESNDTLPDGGTHASDNWDWDGSWGFERTGWILNEINAWVGKIQYTLIHELNHQLGIIDAYNLNYDWNYVKDNEIIPVCKSFDITKLHSVLNYAEQYRICTYMNNSYQSIMRGGASPKDQEYSAFEIGAFNATKGYRRGYFGEYLFDVPANNSLLFINNDWKVPGLTVEIYQASNVNIKLENKIYAGVTDSAGKIALPNRAVTAIPATLTGHSLKPNPFGTISVVGLNGVLLLKLSNGNAIEYKYIDITEFNLAYWRGEKENATYAISTALTGTISTSSTTPQTASSTAPQITPSAPTNTPPSPTISNNNSSNNNGGQSSNSTSSNSPLTAGINATTTSGSTTGNQTQKIGDKKEQTVSNNSNQLNRQATAVAFKQLINAPSAEVETVSGAEAQTIISRQEKSPLDNATKTVYQRVITAVAAGAAESTKIFIAYFIHYGTPTTQILGAGERGGVVNSFYSAYKKLPQSDADWRDAVKIANGRWPTQRNQASEKAAEVLFKKIYQREPQRANAYDDNAVMVAAYGLRPAQRNLNSEQAAIRSFKAIFKRVPSSAVDWDAVRMIAYSGAKR